MSRTEFPSLRERYRDSAMNDTLVLPSDVDAEARQGSARDDRASIERGTRWGTVLAVVRATSAPYEAAYEVLGPPERGRYEVLGPSERGRKAVG